MTCDLQVCTVDDVDYSIEHSELDHLHDMIYYIE